jgi:hypothetical protein
MAGNHAERRDCGCGAAEELAPAKAGAGSFLLLHNLSDAVSMIYPSD